MKELTFEELRDIFEKAGCGMLAVKRLAPNDNSKNQVYFGPGFQALNLFPLGQIVADGRRFKAPMKLSWVNEDGRPVPAPGAQMILYPQYPEVRFSGFLRGCADAPTELMTSREEGRVLVLGVIEGQGTLGYVARADSPVARYVDGFDFTRSALQLGVFETVELSAQAGDSSVTSLLQALGDVHRMGWIRGQRLKSDGSISHTDAPNAGGYTLEAVLGVSANSDAEPDFLGWELKSVSVPSFDKAPAGKRLTLMTPEPQGGFYKTHGVIDFVRTFGYEDKTGRADRLNFGGQFRVGKTEKNTGLLLELDGYSVDRNGMNGQITDPAGGLRLRDPKTDVIAAVWHFSDLMAHWNRKHALAAYVPAEVDKGPPRLFQFGKEVYLGRQTDFLRFLGATSQGHVVYDPGIKVEGNSSGNPREKRRSQFRIPFKHLDELYADFGAFKVL